MCCLLPFRTPFPTVLIYATVENHNRVKEKQKCVKSAVKDKTPTLLRLLMYNGCQLCGIYTIEAHSSILKPHSGVNLYDSIVFMYVMRVFCIPYNMCVCETTTCSFGNCSVCLPEHMFSCNAEWIPSIHQLVCLELLLSWNSKLEWYYTKLSHNAKVCLCVCCVAGIYLCEVTGMGGK